MVSLTEFDGSSLFPNIFEDKNENLQSSHDNSQNWNNKFFYSEAGSNEMKSISFVSGC